MNAHFPYHDPHQPQSQPHPPVIPDVHLDYGHRPLPVPAPGHHCAVCHCDHRTPSAISSRTGGLSPAGAVAASAVGALVLGSVLVALLLSVAVVAVSVSVAALSLAVVTVVLRSMLSDQRQRARSYRRR
ncbi:hypothetical protein [Streptomyces triculaminicus]|uniref:hypothetical protein n=1 Tax=Streptomyces triculaminicus TaxID=2816232 RepID=UPI0037A7DA58